MPQNATHWSNRVRASRIAPSAFCAITWRESLSIFIPSAFAIFCRLPTIPSTEMRLKSYVWQRLRIVGSILCFSVVARMKMACAGGSSRVLRNALNAAEESMCTSSMMYTLYLPTWGGIITFSVRSLMSSTELLEAASSSWMQYERPWAKEMHDSHSPQGSRSAPGFMQFIVFAKILALEVFPTPRGPQNRYAWASCPLFIEFLRVVAMLSCPTRPVKLFGLYFLADTINFSITHKSNNYHLKKELGKQNNYLCADSQW